MDSPQSKSEWVIGGKKCIVLMEMTQTTIKSRMQTVVQSADTKYL